MTQKRAEILLASVIAARATSLLFSKIAMNGMGIFNLLAARFLMAFVLLAVVFFKRLRHIKRHTLVRGAIMGGLFFLMLSTELTGLKSTPSSTVSLLENTAIILVPMAEAVLRHKLPKAATAVSALVAIGGVALLTGQSGGFTPGMVLAVMAAVLYAAAIITTDRFSHEDDPLTLGIVQVGTLGLLALVSSFVFEAPHLPQSGTQWLMIAGLAVICTGFGFTLQPVAQSHTTAQRAGLFCALSPACATLLGAAVLREHISVMGMCGIALILLSLLVPQLWQLAEKKGITLLPRHAVPAVRRACDIIKYIPLGVLSLGGAPENAFAFSGAPSFCREDPPRPLFYMDFTRGDFCPLHRPLIMGTVARKQVQT